MLSLLKKSLVVASVVLGFAATPANADAPFGGALTGFDTLGHSWVTSGTSLSWGEPGLGLGVLSFNPLGTFVEPGVTSATGLSFTFLDGSPGIDAASVVANPALGGFDTTTRFINVTQGYFFTGTLSLSDHRIDFLAPVGFSIDQGDQFFVNIIFDAPLTETSFSFAGNWTYVTPVPEPEIYAMMAAGLGLMGFVARRRKQHADSVI